MISVANIHLVFRDSRVQVLDELVRLNGKPVTEMTREEVLNFVESGPLINQLVIRRAVCFDSKCTHVLKRLYS